MVPLPFIVITLGEYSVVPVTVKPNVSTILSLPIAVFSISRVLASFSKVHIT